MADKSVFDPIKFYATDAEIEERGAKMSLVEDPEGKAVLLVRPFPNDDYARLYADLALKYEDRINDKDTKAANAAAVELNIEAMVKTILVGWENLPYKYSQEKARAMLGNKVLRRRIQEFAANFTNFQERQEEEVKK